MAVRVGRDVEGRLVSAGDSFVLQVTSASDLGAEISALKLARVDLLGLVSGAVAVKAGAAPTVSSVVNSPTGPLFLVEHLAADREIVRSIPDVIVRRLEKAGVDSATVEVPVRGGSLDRLDEAPYTVVLRLFPRRRPRSSG